MKRVGVVLIVLGGLWLSTLLVVQVWIEPAWIPTGDINCGSVWRALPTGEFHEDDACHRAVAHRRVATLIPTGLIVIGVGALLVTRRRKESMAHSVISK
jgi:hypothetical protein